MTILSELLEEIGIKSLNNALYDNERCFALDDEISGLPAEDRADQWKDLAIGLERDLRRTALFGKLLERICVGYYVNCPSDKDDELRDKIGAAIKILSGRVQ
jgi:hypothetical protein